MASNKRAIITLYLPEMFFLKVIKSMIYRQMASKIMINILDANVSV